MAKKSRLLGYMNAMKKGQATKPASSVLEKLSQMKKKTKKKED